MLLTNVTTITEFILVGFPGLERRYYGLVSLLFLLVYLAIVAENCFILITVMMEKCLQKPPYILFCKLGMSDIVIATAILPKMISRYWAEDTVISFPACFLQMFVLHAVQTFNSLLLVIMALDRYIAICNPLRYQALIKNSTILSLCGLSWAISMVVMVNLLVQSVSLPYCKSNTIVHCFCYTVGIISLACQHVNSVQISSFIWGMILLLGPLTFIMFSYTSIIISVMKITNWQGRYKAFSTCSPQLFIICIFFIPRCFNLFISILNVKFGADIHVLITVLYCFIPSLVNPFVYCLRTTEVKDVLVRQLKIIKMRTSCDHS